ncbi:tyrosine-type recombinase/integrase [Variovorax sp. Root473]|uniref:tyrosine-type recombinase/integrase n=1 Tax=Variovorax sp. Root473 TaxID=1736541 RepID=UPI0006FB6540|nr:site-specific integrase [Variovorax sp. Root473]KQX84651.1 hypothetical protein ASD34_22035 [Variovorax sp. Root473]
MSEAYKEGNTYSARLRQDGHDVYVSGFKKKKDAVAEAARRLATLVRGGRPKGLGPAHTTVAQAMQDYGIERLPFLKGAEQEARRINKYLRAARLPLLQVSPVCEDEKSGAYFKVLLQPFTAERVVPNGLHRHRKNLMTQTADSDKHRAVLATKKMNEVQRYDVQGFINSLRLDNLKPASVHLERALLRTVFNYARIGWQWSDLGDNPATHLKMPKVDNARERVLSEDEQRRLDAALEDCRNGVVAPAYVLLRETAMRASEPKNARWEHVDWERKVITLYETKTDKREVPLSPAALQALHGLQPGKPRERIVRISYEALRAAWRRACERAGIKDMHLHDLRHTAATRLALKTGNVFLVKALTGHKTYSMVERYVNVKADDVVKVLHASEPNEKEPHLAKGLPRPADVGLNSARC